jgi:polysaccharide export outer membrane protein
MRLSVWAQYGVIVLVSCTAAGMGCASNDNKYADLKNFVQAHRENVAAVAYRLEPPDVVAISSPTAPEVDGEAQQIRSDGKISLRLLGEVKAAGLTPRELAAKLEELLSRYYVDPKVNVQVAAYLSKNVYVFGQVQRGGGLPFTGRDTVLDVLAKTGPTFLAWGAKVKVIRPSASEEDRSELVINVDEMMQTGDMQNNFLLKEGDIVYACGRCCSRSSL